VPEQVVDDSGTPIVSVAELAAGFAHACAMKTSGDVLCWGFNMYAQLGTGDHTDRLRATTVVSGARHISANSINTCVVKVDGKLWCWGNNLYGQLGTGDTTERASPVMLDSIADVVDVSVGGSPSPGGAFTCALKSDGSLWCWGSNQFGELGNGVTDSNPVTSPVQVMLSCP
jgi:alpha-tubulin suppressor-like RCC1 family protein